MKENRRTFLKHSGLITGSLILNQSIGLYGCSGTAHSVTDSKNKRSGKMKLSYRPYTLELKHTFTIATNSRTTTPVVLTEIEYNGITGYGEASLPPYLGENQDSVSSFLSKVDPGKYSNPLELEEILGDIDAIAPGNTAAKASVDIALHDLAGKLMNQPWYQIWGLNKEKSPNTSFTIGIDTEEIVKQKTKEAAEFKILKIKLGRDTDKMMIETIRSVTDVPICADVNQGWKDQNFALEMLHYLKEKNCVFVEQPMAKDNISGNAWLTEHSPIPIIGDEAIQRIPDLIKAHGVYSGVNIKLMKCTGMREAYKMITLAKSLGMKVMLGCMTETSCAISAASQLSPLVDWADLDGALLIKNDVFEGTKVVNGKIILNDLPGIGVVKKS